MHNTDNVSVDSYVTMKKLLNRCIASLESQLREKDKTIELLQIRDDKRDTRVSNMAGENGHLHALIEEKDKEIERLNAIRDNIIHITFGSGSHQERIRLIKDALKIS